MADSTGFRPQYNENKPLKHSPGDSPGLKYQDACSKTSRVAQAIPVLDDYNYTEHFFKYFKWIEMQQKCMVTVNKLHF